MNFLRKCLNALACFIVGIVVPPFACGYYDGKAAASYVKSPLAKWAVGLFVGLLAFAIAGFMSAVGGGLLTGSMAAYYGYHKGFTDGLRSLFGFCRSLAIPTLKTLVDVEINSVALPSSSPSSTANVYDMSNIDPKLIGLKEPEPVVPAADNASNPKPQPTNNTSKPNQEAANNANSITQQRSPTVIPSNKPF